MRPPIIPFTEYQPPSIIHHIGDTLFVDNNIMDDLYNAEEEGDEDGDKDDEGVSNAELKFN